MWVNYISVKPGKKKRNIALSVTLLDFESGSPFYVFNHILIIVV